MLPDKQNNRQKDNLQRSKKRHTSSEAIEDLVAKPHLEFRYEQLSPITLSANI